MRTALLVLIMTIGVAAQQRDARVTPTGGTAVITGTVVSSDGRRPIRRAIVRISGSALTTPRSAITDDAGRFAFGQLPAGTFAITAQKAAFLAAQFGSSKPGRPGSHLALGAAETRAITLTMFKGAAVGGILKHPNGSPATGVNVVAINTQLGQRDRRSDAVVTNDQGEYRIYGLMPGEYVVVATPTAGGEGDIGARSAADMDAVLARLAQRRGADAVPAATPRVDAPMPPAPVVGYAPIYFPGTPVLNEAEKIRLGTEEDRGSVSFNLPRVPVATISGTVSGDFTDLTGIQLALVSELSELRWGGPGLSVGITAVPPNKAGEFEYRNVPPGPIRVVARGRSASNEAMYAWADLDVRQDVRDLRLELRPGGTMSGVVVFDSGGTPVPSDISRWRVGLALAGDTNMLQMGALKIGTLLSDVPQVPIKPDGTFALTGIGPAAYAIAATVPADLITTWRLRSAMADGRDLLDSGMSGPDVSLRGVTLTFSDKRTEISGSLVSASGQPAAEYYVIAFSTDRTNWRRGSRRSQSARPATNGHFVFTDLPAGEYFIAALTDLDPAEWQESAFLEQVAAAAVKIRLGEGEKKIQDLRIK